MRNGIHFISGLPRAAPRSWPRCCAEPSFAAGMTSRLAACSTPCWGHQRAQRGRVFLDDDQRQRLLRAVFDAFYADIHPTGWYSIPIVSGHETTGAGAIVSERR